ncbi:MAG: BamA/TamA family outer membrane protein [Rubrivivax sp.]|nr:BamA/TamA family outer membrane protein [Rubrivivax sp.]
MSAAAFAQPPAPLPSFAELEAAGAKVGQIRISAQDVFDLTDPKEDKALFRLANKLHVQTRPSVIERALLFQTGDPVSVRLIEENERLLRGNRYLYDVQFRVAAVHEGVADIDVVTRDTWSLELGGSIGRQGGANTSGVQIRDHNLLGTGVSASLGRSKTVDRSGTEVRLTDPRAFGGWTAVDISHASNSDGKRDAFSVAHPFYALDSRWAAGASAVSDDRVDAIYNAGSITGRYRHTLKQGELFGGWSEGLVGGWVNRLSFGLSVQDDAYAVEPGLAPPASLPAEQRLRGPFARWELIEDRYEREFNRNLIGKPEFFALGWASTVQLGWASTRMGSLANALLYSASASGGTTPAPGQLLVLAAKVSGQVIDGTGRHEALGVQAQYYLPQSPRWLFYASAAADAVRHADAAEALQLGGDNGLRGYPLRYQSGTRRALFSAEERFYTDLYIWQLFRIGGAAFFDIGRAWGGEGTNTVNPGWLKNVGAGLRIVSTRSAFSNVLHIDIAMPLDATSDIKKVQLLVKTRATF